MRARSSARSLASADRVSQTSRRRSLPLQARASAITLACDQFYVAAARAPTTFLQPLEGKKKRTLSANRAKITSATAADNAPRCRQTQTRVTRADDRERRRSAPRVHNRHAPKTEETEKKTYTHARRRLRLLISAFGLWRIPRAARCAPQYVFGGGGGNERRTKATTAAQPRCKRTRRAHAPHAHERKRSARTACDDWRRSLALHSNCRQHTQRAPDRPGEHFLRLSSLVVVVVARRRSSSSSPPPPPPLLLPSPPRDEPRAQNSRCALRFPAARSLARARNAVFLRASAPAVSSSSHSRRRLIDNLQRARAHSFDASQPPTHRARRIST